jgi:hypothetical protein
MICAMSDWAMTGSRNTRAPPATAPEAVARSVVGHRTTRVGNFTTRHNHFLQYIHSNYELKFEQYNIRS